MTNHKFLLSIYFYTAFILTCHAQEISFNHLTIKDGLSSNTVRAIYQDEYGLIWIGTQNGVNMYNGEKIKVYQYKKNDPNSLHYNDVTQITGNGKGTIYFMTSKGISAFDTHTETFTTLIQQNISSIYYYDELYIAIKNNIYQYDRGKFKLYYSLPHIHAQISQILITNDSTIIGTYNQGLYILDKEKKLTHLLQQTRVCDILKDSSGRLWIPTWEHGLYMINKQYITNFRHNSHNNTSISSDFTYQCCEDKQGNIWIGTFNGLNLYNEATHSFIQYTKYGKEKGLTYLSIWSLFCDQQGTIWAGTYFGGINYFNLNNQIYQEYNVATEETQGLSFPIVGQIIEDNDHNLWICTEGGGINKYNRQTNSFTWYKHDEKQNSLSHNNAKALYYDKQSNTLWIGTHMGGLNKLNLHNGHFTQYLANKNNTEALPSNTIRDIVYYQDQLIIATNCGVYLFNPKTAKCKPMFKDQQSPFQIHDVLSLMIDSQNILWIIGSDHGTCTYNFTTKELKQYSNPTIKTSINNDIINNIFEDSQKRLWFCSNENGLYLYDPQKQIFENFDKQKNRFASNVIYNICELTPNRLLLTTDCGISIFDINNKLVQNYNQNNGLPQTFFNKKSLCKTTDGEVFIGGIDGMISFRPNNLNNTPRTYRILPNRLFVNGEEITVNDKSGILSQSFSTTQHITLKSHQNIFDIEYTMTNYLPFYKDEIVYRLEGFSDIWNSLKDRNTITYTNLSPGTYTLIVKAQNVDKSFIPESRLEIKILPPFYQTLWAYLAYFICTITTIYYLVRTYHHRIKLQEALKYEKKHAVDIENLNQAKLNFFTNISHEFRTPLTLIIGQIEILIQARSFAPTLYNKILSIYKSCLQLKGLVSELLDFQKQEQGYMTIKVSEHNIADFVYEYYLLFQEYAAQRNITFSFFKNTDYISAWFDARQMQKVMNNLIFNAFKHTKEGGRICISVKEENQSIIVEIKDNGDGISPEDINNIFDKFYQSDSLNSLSYTGTGIGLALTKGIIELHKGTIRVQSLLGQGSTFCITLKSGKKHFSEEQICTLENNTLDIPINHQEITPLLSVKPNIQEKSVKARTTKILIVEDNNSLREMLKQLFEIFYHVILASNGEEGLEKVQKEQPDIVLSDVVMPKMSGIELCHKLKNNFDTCHIPIVLLTARTAIEHNLEGLKTGADDYITKPFNVNILLSRCNNLINNRILLQEKFTKSPQASAQVLATNPIDQEFVDQAIKIVEKHIDNSEFNIDVFASEMAIARTKLFTKMKAITGQTPHEFIMTFRLKQAAILLRKHSELSISDISDRLGFCTPKHFSKCFKEKYHIVPQKYRKAEFTPTEEQNNESQY